MLSPILGKEEVIASEIVCGSGGRGTLTHPLTATLCQIESKLSRRIRYPVKLYWKESTNTVRKRRERRKVLSILSLFLVLVMAQKIVSSSALLIPRIFSHCSFKLSRNCHIQFLIKLSHVFLAAWVQQYFPAQWRFGQKKMVWGKSLRRNW